MKLSEISKQIGVSTATISRVINNEPNVAPKTKQKVLEALKSIDYKPKKRDKSIARKNNDTAFIVAGQLNNPITLEYINGIRTTLTQNGIQTLIAISDYNEDSEISYLRFAKCNYFLGIFLINAIESPQLVDFLDTSKLPVVFVNRYLRSRDCDLVKIDNYRIGYLATGYLINLGHKKIGHLAGPISSITCQDRTRGFIDAMKAAGLSINENTIHYSTRDYFDSGCEFGRLISSMPEKERFTAVFSTTSIMASGIVEELNNKGIKVPQNISIVCSDDSERFYHKATNLTTVGINPYIMGVAAAELLLERLKDPNGQPKHVVYSPELTERESVRSISDLPQ